MARDCRDSGFQVNAVIEVYTCHRTFVTFLLFLYFLSFYNFFTVGQIYTENAVTQHLLTMNLLCMQTHTKMKVIANTSANTWNGNHCRSIAAIFTWEVWWNCASTFHGKATSYIETDEQIDSLLFAINCYSHKFGESESQAGKIYLSAHPNCQQIETTWNVRKYSKCSTLSALYTLLGHKALPYLKTGGTSRPPGDTLHVTFHPFFIIFFILLHFVHVLFLVFVRTAGDC